MCNRNVCRNEKRDCGNLIRHAVYEDFGEEARQGDKKGTRGRFVVYHKEAGTFVEKAVDVGLKSDIRLEILSGLALDDSVASQAEKMFQKKAKEKKKEKDKEQKDKEQDGDET